MGRYKLSSALKTASEIAGFDYVLKGFSHDFLLSKDMLFLVSQVSLKILSFPYDQQGFTVSTWENGKKGALFLRGFEMLDENDEMLIQGLTGWVLINPKTHRIYRPIEFPYPQQQLNEVFECVPLGKILYSNLVKLGERQVRYSDIDPNNHVNNAIYADIAVDVLPEEYLTCDLENFRIIYCNQALLGDKIDLFGEKSENKYVIVGFIGDKLCFETEFIFA
jgi:acyl-ACP thioesterase